MWRTRLQIDEYLFMTNTVRLLLCIPSRETWKKYYYFKPKDGETEHCWKSLARTQNSSLLKILTQQSQLLCHS